MCVAFLSTRVASSSILARSQDRVGLLSRLRELDATISQQGAAGAPLAVAQTRLDATQARILRADQ